MSPNERFEIEATVFYRMFGMLAPGKDDSSLLHDDGDRMQTWEAFKTVYGKAVNGTIDAMLGIEVAAPMAKTSPRCMPRPSTGHPDTPVEHRCNICGGIVHFDGTPPVAGCWGGRM